MNYSIGEWLLIFYLYAFMGWIWESTYVSVKSKELVNRGFLNGPWIPLYGFGACLVLFLALPLRNNLILVFLVGMLATTILEYVTGELMAKIFKVTYWDYSDKKYNINGHVYLQASLCWGVFSVILVRCIHQPIENLVIELPYVLKDLASHLLTILFAMDTSLSVKSAMDLKVALSQFRDNILIMDSLQEKISDLEKNITDRTREFSNLRERLMKEEIKGEDIKDRVQIRLIKLKKKYPKALSKEFESSIMDLHLSLKEKRDSLRFKLKNKKDQ